MKHIRKISAVRADAYTDFLISIWERFLDFLYAKKQGA